MTADKLLKEVEKRPAVPEGWVNGVQGPAARAVPAVRDHLLSTALGLRGACPGQPLTERSKWEPTPA